MTNDEIQELLTERKIPEIDLKGGKFDRKKAISELEMFDMKSGDGTELIETDEDGIVKEERPKPSKGDAEDWEKIMFHSTSQDDDPYVFMGHNGKAYYAPKEEPIFIPKFLLNSCIKDAVEDREVVERDPDGKKRTVIKKIHRFPYTIVRD